MKTITVSDEAYQAAQIAASFVRVDMETFCNTALKNHAVKMRARSVRRKIVNPDALGPAWMAFERPTPL